MKLLCGFKQIVTLNVNTATTIGNFDGVHRGHQELISSLRKRADELDLPSLVLLFEPQPGEYFKRREAPARLSGFREKIDLLKQLGIDYVCFLKFNHSMASMPANEFAQSIIFSLLKTKYLLLGEDFRFGRDRAGDISLLADLGRSHDCVVENFPDFRLNDDRVSSTKIRHCLQLGYFERATQLLGRPYTLVGRVIRGNGLGRTWGIPTANIGLRRMALPLKGVFCVLVTRENNSTLLGVANMGCRPTVDGTKNVLEVHLFDTDESLYGERLHVCFLHKLRDEIKFSSVDVLIERIRSDVVDAKRWFLTDYKRDPLL